MNKKWFEIIDFYRLTGIVFIWISAWIFMIPWKADITSPYFDNVWGAFFAFFGAVAEKTVKTQQMPDLLSGLFALAFIFLLHLRGILNITDNEKLSEKDLKNHRLLIVCMNIFSIIVHTLFFAMLIKIFLFPDKGNSAVLARLEQNFTVTVLFAVCITGMLLGGAAVSKILMIIFSLAAIFFNVNFVNSTMGIWGFIAIIFAATGFYLEFCVNGFKKENLMIDLAYISGKYEKLELKAKNEILEIKQSTETMQKIQKGKNNDKIKSNNS